MLASGVTLVQYAIMAAALGGDYAVNMVVGTPLADYVTSIQSNKFGSLGGAWFVGSSLGASLQKTGAFEVQIRDSADEAVTVWSGIARGGRPPATQEEMVDIIDALRAAGVGAAPEAVPDF